jgi:hypothetical protein
MHNPETLTILDTQDTGRKQRKKRKKIQPRTPPNIMHPLCYSYSQDVLETNIYFIILNVEVDWLVGVKRQS